MDRLAVLQAFALIAETGSFSETARRLGVSKSAVSRGIAALEAGLGARLVQRTTRSLALTEAGRAYHDRVARALADLDEAGVSVSHLQEQPRGRLRVNAPMSFGVRHLAPALGAFLARYPEVEVDIVMNDRFVDLIEEGYDVAIRIGRLGDSSLIVRPLAPLRRVVCASPAYWAAHGIPETPDGLAGHRCLLYTNLSPADEWRFCRADASPWPVRVHGPIRINNGDALGQAVLDGGGVALLPTFIVGADLAQGRLIAVLEEFVPQEGAIQALYPQGRHLSPKVRCFVDFLAERFKGGEPWERGAPAL